MKSIEITKHGITASYYYKKPKKYQKETQPAKTAEWVGKEGRTLSGDRCIILVKKSTLNKQR